MRKMKRKPWAAQKMPKASEGRKEERIAARIEKEMNQERLVAVLTEMVLHYLNTLRGGSDEFTGE